MTNTPQSTSEWLDELFENWEHEATGIPKQWPKTEERQAMDSKYRAELKDRIAAERAAGKSEAWQYVIDEWVNGNSDQKLHDCCYSSPYDMEVDLEEKIAAHTPNRKKVGH